MDNDNQNADTQLVRVPDEGEANVNVTYANQNGDLPDPVLYDSTDEDVVRMAQEALRGGGIPGVDANMGADLSGYKVDRISAKDNKPNRLFVRPKTEFGSSYTIGGRLKTRGEMEAATSRLIKAAKKAGFKKADLITLVSSRWDEDR